MNPPQLHDAIEHNARRILDQVDRMRRRLGSIEHLPEMFKIITAAWAVIGHAAAIRRQRRRPGDVPVLLSTEAGAVAGE